MMSTIFKLFSDVVFTGSFINICHFKGYVGKNDIWERWYRSLENDKKWVKDKRYHPRGCECLEIPLEERGKVYFTDF